MNDFNFEKSMEELQNIVDQLEKGELTLNESVDLFKEGVLLSKLCSDKLDDVERRITILTKDGEKDEEASDKIFEIDGD